MMRIRFTSFLCLVAVCIAINQAATAVGQINFISSEITLQAGADASFLNPENGDTESDSDTDMAEAFDALSFMDGANAEAFTTGNSGSSDVDGAFNITGSAIDASGSANASAFGGGLDDSASAFGDVDLEIVFEITRAGDYTADIFVGSMMDGSASVRLSPSSGIDVFFEEAISFSDDSTFGTISGRLTPDTYTLAAFSQASAFASEGSSFDGASQFEITLGFTPDPRELVFRCDPLPYCVERIDPSAFHIHGVIPGPADEPIPFWTEGFDVAVALGEIFEFADGPAPADLVIVTAPFDGPEDMYPEDVYELGTNTVTTLAFAPGSLSSNTTLGDLPLDQLLGVTAELFNPNGLLLHSSRQMLVPEPSAVALLLGLASLSLCLRRRR